MMLRLRTLLILGRVSNLPTVWSNCLAGWWLGGAGNRELLPLLFIGATLLYVGGMFLNDACDAEFDRQHRPERPIPSGQITRKTVVRIAYGLLASGSLILVRLGAAGAGLGLALLLAIVLYDRTHKQTHFAPWLMGLCRFLLYLLASTAGADGLSSSAVWCGLALAAYIAGLSYLARGEPTAEQPSQLWPVLLLAAPILLALLLAMKSDEYNSLLLAAVLGLWTARCLRPALGPYAVSAVGVAPPLPPEGGVAHAPGTPPSGGSAGGLNAYGSDRRNLGQAVSGLLAGIVLVDWLAAAASPRELGAVFIALFLAAIAAQRYVPAT